MSLVQLPLDVKVNVWISEGISENAFNDLIHEVIQKFHKSR